MRFLKVITLFVFIAFLSIGCGDSDDGGGNASLVGTWLLTDFQGPAALQPPDPTTLVFTDTTYTFTVANECEGTGVYITTGTTITFTTSTITGNANSYCSDPGDTSTVNYTVTSTTFTFIDDEVTLTFQRQ